VAQQKTRAVDGVPILSKETFRMPCAIVQGVWGVTIIRLCADLTPPDAVDGLIDLSWPRGIR